MTFSIYFPPGADSIDRNSGSIPVLLFLAGLTCTDDNFAQKSFAMHYAAQLEIALLIPDTSPRSTPENPVPDVEAWDFGQGAGFYLDATQPPFKEFFNMKTYITKEIFDVLNDHHNKKFFQCLDLSRKSIMGHSMGGHGALTIALRNPEMYKSVSAFAPICNPINCPWGQKAFDGYLGPNKEAWKEYDATELVKVVDEEVNVLISQGSEDQFLKQGQLLPENFLAATKENELIKVQYKLEEGYDHSYYFISTFIGEHLNFHAKYLHPEN